MCICPSKVGHVGINPDIGGEKRKRPQKLPKYRAIGDLSTQMPQKWTYREGGEERDYPGLWGYVRTEPSDRGENGQTTRIVAIHPQSPQKRHSGDLYDNDVKVDI